MKFILTLPLRAKVLLAPIVSALLFVVYLGYGFLVNAENADRLGTLRNASFPALEHASGNITRLEKITEILNAAVMAGEADMLAQADEQAAKVRESLTKFKALDPTKLAEVDKAAQHFESYFQSARSVSSDLIAKTLSMGQAGARISEMKAAQDAVHSTFVGLRETTHQRFTETVDQSLTASSRALTLGLGFALVILIGGLSTAFVMSNLISKNVRLVMESIREMASGQGDLTHRLKRTTNDEVGQLVDHFNQFMTTLQSNVVHIVQSASELTSVMGRLKNFVSSQGTLVTQEKNAISSVHTEIAQIHSQVQQVAANAEAASQATSTADSDASVGQHDVADASKSIDALAKQIADAYGQIGALRDGTTRIGSVVGVIKGIADQTNLLALNAAIEAARAGEQGRGFAVVADQVRKLSGDTQSATVEVAEIVEKLRNTMEALAGVIEQSQSAAVESVSKVDASAQSLNRIVGQVRVIRTMNDDIANATEQQSRASETITERMTELSDVASSATQAAASLASLCDEIHALSDRLHRVAGQFKV